MPLRGRLCRSPVKKWGRGNRHGNFTNALFNRKTWYYPAIKANEKIAYYVISLESTVHFERVGKFSLFLDVRESEKLFRLAIFTDKCFKTTKPMIEHDEKHFRSLYICSICKNIAANFLNNAKHFHTLIVNSSITKQLIDAFHC